MKKIAFLFPGQGSQYVGMGKTLCDKFSIARDTFEEANSVLKYDLKKICFDGPHDVLSDTKNTQPAILAASVASFKVFMQEFGVEPDILAGHSFGALTALVCSDSLSFSDALIMARFKGEIADKEASKIKSGMIAVEDIKKREVENICEESSKNGGGVFIGIINSPNQIVISGEESSVAFAEKMLNKAGARIERLSVSAPFHTPLLKGSAEEIKKKISSYKFKNPKWPILSSITAKVEKDIKKLTDDLYLDLVRPTDWLATVKYLAKNNFRDGVEIGPKTVLKKIVEATTDKIKMHSCISPKDIEPLKDGLKLDKNSKMEVLIAVLRIIVTTKNENDDIEEFERNVSVPYTKVKKLLLGLREKDKEPTMENIIDSLRKLELMMRTKMIPKKEMKERLMEEIFDEYFALLHIPEIREIFSAHIT